MQMNGKTILFRLRNEQEDYAQCMEILKSFQTNQRDECNKIVESTFVLPYFQLNSVSIEQMICLKENRLSDYTEIREKNNVLTRSNILIEVSCNDNENDIVNLQFFFLIRQWLIRELHLDAGRIGLYVKATEDLKKEEIMSLYFKASDFLVYQYGNQSHYFGDYVGPDGKKKVTPLSFKNRGILKKFSPLIEVVTSTGIGIEYWQQSVGSFFNRCSNSGIRWNEIEPQTILEADKKNVRQRIRNCEKTLQCGNSSANEKMQKLLLEKEEIEKRIDAQKKQFFGNEHYRLLLTLKNFFCTREVFIARKRSDFSNKKEFLEIVKEMSLLSFYVFCLFEYHSANDLGTKFDYKNDIESFYQMVLKTRDLCDGFAQLMQNVIEHSYFGTGYFFVRIHDKNDKAYLKNKYSAYMENLKDYDSTELFLEMQLIDYSLMNVPDKFMENMKKRMENAEESDKEKYKELLSDNNAIKLSTFFKPDERETEFWEKYYNISDNIVHHYGLQMFDSVIDSNDGCFLAVSTPEFKIKDSQKCVYCSFAQATLYDGEYHIPGTQYSVLLPLRYSGKVEYTAVNADINYTDLLVETYHTIKLEVSGKYVEEAFSECKDKSESEQKAKEKLVMDISDKLLQQLSREENSNTVYYIDMLNDSFETKYLELFCKMIIRFISKRPEKKTMYIALLNCSDKYIIEITRMFTIFYNKWGQSQLFEDVQIYLSGTSPENAFLFAGRSIATVLNRAERLAIARGVQPDCINILTEMLQRKALYHDPGNSSMFSIVPFELLQYGNKEILFKDILNNILENDICRIRTGCKVSNTHVRLGSKIHLTEFYQAEILFQNNYFTTRFAYLVADDIYNSVGNKKNLILVGYETYSEMLIYEIQSLLKKKYGMDVPYLIYEQKNGERFRYIQELLSKGECSYIYLVPINSTLTTHNKMQAALKRIREDAFCVAENYGIILLSPPNETSEPIEIQREYGWKKVDDKEILSTLVQGERVKYFFRKDIEWNNAMGCKCCFPTSRYDEERPLIETNRASIIPMQKFELIEDTEPEEKQEPDRIRDKNNQQRVEALSDCLVYSHLERNGNHFNYYFQMGKFFRRNKQGITEWLESIKIDNSNDGKTIVFNVLVAPQHYSNNGFVEEVNKRVFQNASLVLDIEINKEFRSNVKAKYSNLLLLYKNLKNCSRKAEICFHYVDDTIISGTTFYRAQSLIRSIFPEKVDEQVKITIFKSVFLMLNRSSSYSKLNYNKTNFFAYVDLAISSMRIQEDACVLCKIVKDSEKMKELSATYAMSQYWEERRTHHVCRNTKEIDPFCFSGEQRERAKRRMLCSHKANLILDSKVRNRGNVKEVKKCIIENLLLSEKDSELKKRFEWELSYLKVLSRPFFSFSVVIRKAIFQILLELLDYMIGNKALREQCPELSELFDHMNELEKQNEYRLRYVLFFTMIKRLSDLGSTFIIRRTNIERILTFYETVKEGDYKRSFELEYRACIKKLAGLSGDEIKETWLEYLLLNKVEYNANEKEPGIISAKQQRFYHMLYMENTRVFRDAVWDLTKEVRAGLESKVKQENTDHKIEMKELRVENQYMTVEKNYYYKNFRLMYDWNFSNEKKLLDDICVFYNYLLYGSFIYTDVRMYYRELAGLMRKVTSAECVQIILPNGVNDYCVIGDTSYADENCIKEEFRTLFEQNAEYEDDSYCLDQEKTGVLKFSNHLNEKSGRSIYFGFIFSRDKKDKIIKYLRNILLFRNEIMHKFEEDFATNAIQQFLVSTNQNKLLTGSGTIDHSYAKTRSQFLEESLYIAANWEEKFNQKVIDDGMLKDVKDQVGFLYSTVANSIISRLFQKSVVGQFDANENAASISKEWLSTTILFETEKFNLYERSENITEENDGQLMECRIHVEKKEELENYYTYTIGDFILSAIFLLLIINAGTHAQCGEVKVTISIRSGEDALHDRIVFSSPWNDMDAEEKVKRLNKNIRNHNYDPSQGITLWTLNKYFCYLTRNKENHEIGIEVSANKKEDVTYFNIELPVFRKDRE